MLKSKTVTLVEDEDTGDLILPIGDEFMEAVGWEVGDTLEWINNNDGSFTLSKTKSEETELVLVECISQFRQRYMVEVPKGKAEWAMDTVTLNQADEFSQSHLGETIVSHRVVSKEEMLALCDKDNDYAKAWNDEHKMKTFVTSWDKQK
jgi:bifunctional DNA-binding transcriptional regulator/antitoxin component of YhaV-PrlF toxin-antitoxin module